MKIYFIRHCKTNNNLLNKWQGTTDQDLSEEGIKELTFLQNKIDFIPHIIYTSPFKRTKETANAIKKDETLVVEENIIVERNFGLLENQEVNDLHKEELANFDLNSDLNLGVEKIQDMYYLRIKPFLINIKKEHEGTNKNIVIVSHSWVGRLIHFFSTGEKNKEVIAQTPKHGHIYEFHI